MLCSGGEDQEVEVHCNFQGVIITPLVGLI